MRVPYCHGTWGQGVRLSTHRPQSAHSYLNYFYTITVQLRQVELSFESKTELCTCHLF